LQGSFLYHGGLSCLPTVCLENLLLGLYPFPPSSIQFAGGNELFTTTETMSMEAFENHGHGPAQFIGIFYLPGTLSITYEGRTSATELGTFPTLLTSFDYSGSFGSHTFETRLDTGRSGIPGMTHLFQAGPGLFGVESGFGGFVESSLDNGPFVQGQVGFGLESPEPGSAGMALLGFAGLAAASRIRRRVAFWDRRGGPTAVRKP
jgi:hypothetical protein